MKKLKAWNGIYGCSSFNVTWENDGFHSIEEAKKYYENIWDYCWIEEK